MLLVQCFLWPEGHAANASERLPASEAGRRRRSLPLAEPAPTALIQATAAALALSACRACFNLLLCSNALFTEGDNFRKVALKNECRLLAFFFRSD